MKTLSTSVALVSTLWLLAAPAHAAPPVLDQQSPAADPIPFTFAVGGETSRQVLYQSFTVGRRGRLAEIRLPIGCESGRVILEIFTADGAGLPLAGTRPLLTRRYAANLFPEVVTGEFHPLLLGGRVGVTPGERLVMVVSNPTGSCGVASGAAGDGYPNGTGYADDTTDTAPPVHLSLSPPTNPDDLPFQTYVRLTGPRVP